MGITAGVYSGSLLALIYVWKIVETAYFAPVAEGVSPEPGEAPLSFLLPLWLLLLANFYFGIDTSLTIGVAETTAQQLLGVSP